ncbi:MAG: hypothetical protein ABEJ78_02535 [Haloferacaceae archaeon]
MVADELISGIERVRTVDRDEFDAQVEAEASRLKADVRDGVFDNPQAIVGLEYELYAVARDDATLRRIPRQLLELIGFEKELGLHNAEMHTSPQPLNAYGLAAQLAEVQARLDAALTKTAAEDIRLVSDGLWTLSPRGESATTYLTSSVETEGVRLMPNVSDDVRYQAMVNGEYTPQASVETPTATLSTDVVTPESLATSIQPHYQVAHAPDLSETFAYAVRVAGPLLALGVNSPFFPPELYDDSDPERVLAEGWAENRVPVFEGVMNAAEGERKVRFPRDFATVEEAIDRIAADRPVVPATVDADGRFDDRYRHLRHKHGTFWRWVRPVFDGATRSGANARIEFRALPAQPTVRDNVAFVAAFAGLMESLPRRKHPVSTLDWEVARENFYAAMRDGLDADLRWITANGEETTETEAIIDELLEHARDGLAIRGLSRGESSRHLDVLRRRLSRGRTPASWKRERVRRAVDDGATLAEAIETMQRTYVRRQRETLVNGSFLSW